ncbi:uncharacterized protein KY384_000413 [Bacidia gigantensis]|uniref:uncharacterized protein n=1 Tax=Bacidia gigantensis TaxID=2732470 RepID=UPI001D03E250|nr:uncharacterized protein KY384_000413 [Bacidia gigantensis]KAG8525653.1 hypothetical protein KY384_000413 [Bacidia gigantensis]
MYAFTTLTLLATSVLASPTPQIPKPVSKLASDPGYLEGCPQEKKNCTRIVLGQPPASKTMIWGSKKPSDLIDFLRAPDGPCSPGDCNTDDPNTSQTTDLVIKQAMVDVKATKPLKITVKSENVPNGEIRDLLVTALQAAFMSGAKHEPRSYLNEEGKPFLGRVAPPEALRPKIVQWTAGTQYTVKHRAYTPEGYGETFDMEVNIELDDMQDANCADVTVGASSGALLAGTLSTVFPLFAVVAAVLGVVGPICNKIEDTCTEEILDQKVFTGGITADALDHGLGPPPFAHKRLCKDMAAIGDAPSPVHDLVIFLPEGDSDPKLVWVSSNSNEEAYNLLGPQDDHTAELNHFDGNHLRNFAVDNEIEILYRDNMINDGSSKNQTLYSLTTLPIRYTWNGPIVIMKSIGIGPDAEGRQSITLADFRHAIDWFVMYRGFMKPAKNLDYDISRIQGVKISCRGEERELGTAKYSTVKVPKDHPIFRKNDAIPISKCVRTPLLVRKLGPDPAWETKDYGPFVNQEATFLNLDCLASSGTFCWAAPEWQNEVGNVIVVRQDQGVLLAKHVEVLCKYLMLEIMPAKEIAAEAGQDFREVTDLMTEKKFKEYFEVYRGEKIAAPGTSNREKDDWRSVPVPFKTPLHLQHLDENKIKTFDLHAMMEEIYSL